MKKVIVMSLIASSMFFNIGCDEGDVAAGIIGVGVGVGVGAIVGGHDGYHDGYHDGRRDQRRNEDRWGRGGYVRPERPGRYRECGRYGCYAASVKFDTTNIEAASANSTVDIFAEKYHITPEASVKIQSAFAEAKDKGISSFEAIGLTKRDLKLIARKQLPAAESLKNMSEKLDMSEAQSRDLVQSMISEFSLQAGNVESAYWQSCMAKGKWKTPENTSCSNTSWTGCAPATGATLCY